MKRFFTFGDSWSYGAELQRHEKTFGELISQQLGIRWHDFSVASTSIPHLILQLNRAKEYCDIRDHDWQFSGTTALFFLTSPHRDLVWRDGRDKELHKVPVYLNPSHESDIDIRWYTEWHTPELATYRVNTTLMALHHLCRYHGIDDRYVWGWDRVELCPEVDRGRFWDFGASTILDLFDDVDHRGSITTYSNTHPNRYVWPNSGHPNQQGHQRIATALTPWLEPTFRPV
jgi:hypothetical protein